MYRVNNIKAFSAALLFYLRDYYSDTCTIVMEDILKPHTARNFGLVFFIHQFNQNKYTSVFFEERAMHCVKIIQEAFLAKKNVVCFPLLFATICESHANLLIYRIKHKTLERFEPYANAQFSNAKFFSNNKEWKILLEQIDIFIDILQNKLKEFNFLDKEVKDNFYDQKTFSRHIQDAPQYSQEYCKRNLKDVLENVTYGVC
jgi:hypothetical protein